MEVLTQADVKRMLLPGESTRHPRAVSLLALPTRSDSSDVPAQTSVWPCAPAASPPPAASTP